MARRVKRFLRNPRRVLSRRLRNPENALMRRRLRSKKTEFKQIKSEIKSERREEYKRLKNEVTRLQNEIKHKKQEYQRIGKESLAAKDPAERSAYEERRERIQQERLQLRAELRAAKRKERAANTGRKKSKKTAQQEIFQLERERRTAGEQETGALPDFLIIGEKKCGTTYLYHLLTQHPLVEPAASKELHFFDVHFEEGVEWYRRCFPKPRQKDARKTITGEATPYMSHRLAPERVAGVVPKARLIALLRNPVDRTYSDYQQMASKGRDTRTFEEATVTAKKARLLGEGRRDRAGGDGRHWYLSRSVYVDQLLRWREFFDKEQMLVLKSEDFFENPPETLKVVLDFLDLPDWRPEVSELRFRRNKGLYRQEMNPATRKQLEEYFEPHNRRLYDYLGVDFGW